MRKKAQSPSMALAKLDDNTIRDLKRGYALVKKFGKNRNAELREELEAQGVTFKNLVHKHIQLLKAQRVNFNGVLVPNHSIQMKALEKAYELLGGNPIPEQKIKITKEDESHFTPEQIQAARAALVDYIDVEVIENTKEGSGSEATAPLS